MKQKESIMKRLNRYQIFATLFIAIFIVSVSVCILSRDRKTYRYSVNKYFDSMSSEEKQSLKLDREEMTDCYNELADKVTSFFKKDYQLSEHDISAVNVDRLSAINRYIRGAWLIAVFSAIGFVYCFIVLSRRRLYMPLAYGTAVAALLTSLMTLRYMLSKRALIKGVRRMILYGKYDYFVSGDIVRMLIPPGFARALLVRFFMIEATVILIFLLVHWIIIRSGRPHKF